MTCEEQKKRIMDALGVDEIMLQLGEECSELDQAAHKLHRAKRGLTPVSEQEALSSLAEEAADVTVCLEMLVEMGVIDPEQVSIIAQSKTDRWYQRTFGDEA